MELRQRWFQCCLAVRRQRCANTGWAELDELGPGTGDKGVQKCVIAWLGLRILEANWCFSAVVCDTSAFTTSVPKLRIDPLAEHIQHFKFIIRYGFEPTDFWLFKPTLVKFTLSHSCSRFRSLSLSRTGEVYSDNFQPGCWQNATYVPGYLRKYNTLS